MATVIYETLLDKDQAKINAIVSSVKEHLTVNGLVDIDLLMATLEQLNEVKRSARDEIKKAEKEQADKEKIRLAEIGKLYVLSLKEGDMITFIYGSAGKQKKATLPLEKVGSATVQVSYPPEMLGPLSQTPKRNIHFDKIVVPESFIKTLEQSA